MTVKAGIRQNKLILTLYGEIDDNGAESIRQKMDGFIEKSECDTVIFDLTGVSFMDSTGIG
ncbi:MAG: STAS domain-containing protein, partial [Clostridia bacterium]|nr:STAS domain-containing protein [Clostridia bacterium]